MTNPILQRVTAGPTGNNLLQRMAEIKRMISGANPNQMYQALLSSNPNFRRFVSQNSGKSVQQICAENGIDYSMFTSLFR